ncbi:unnamed protein product [Callosobruchus maculatus]|uniref:Uncharacterized protein n=1 Tax=Callosobruchus maculatus TaxID=64391 RepID=A0A653CJV1_CALMS|nr:unnamed protein product [Callosobruchus maculatus]
MDATILFQAAIPFSDGHLETSIGNVVRLSLRLNENELHLS